MLVLLPFFILSLAALAITVIQWVRSGLGYSWLAAILFCLVTWVILLIFGWQQLLPFSIVNWQPVDLAGSAIVFNLDRISWPYAFAITSLLVAVILTVSARLHLQSSPVAWAGSLAVTSAGMLAILAETPLTLILAWTVIDIIELVVLLGTAGQSENAQRVVLAFAVRVMGTLLAVWAMLVSLSEAVNFSLSDVSPEVGLYLLLAAGLRLGVIPLRYSYAPGVRMRRGLGTILRLVAPASTLPLLANLPARVVPPDLARALLVFTALAGLYGSGMWLAARDEIEGQPYWIISLASMAVGSAIRGHPEASLVWGVAMILPGGVLFLFSARSRWVRLLPLIAWLGLTGLPFTPAASGWRGLIVLPFTLLDVVFILAHATIQVGLLRHALKPGEDLTGMERWVQVVYPLGLVLLLVAQWITGVFGWTSGLAGEAWNGLMVLAEGWWGAVIAGGLCIVGSLMVNQIERRAPLTGGRFLWLIILVRRVVNTLEVIARLEWLYQLLWTVYGWFGQLVRLVTALLEGDGGVLWAVLLLVIFIRFIQLGGFP